MTHLGLSVSQPVMRFSPEWTRSTLAWSEGGSEREWDAKKKSQSAARNLGDKISCLSLFCSVYLCMYAPQCLQLPPPFATLPFETHTDCMPRVPRQHAPLGSCFTMPCLPRPPPVIDKGSSVAGDIRGRKRRRGERGIIRVIFLGKARFRTHGLPCAFSGEDVASAATQRIRSCFRHAVASSIKARLTDARATPSSPGTGDDPHWGIPPWRKKKAPFGVTDN